MSSAAIAIRMILPFLLWTTLAFVGASGCAVSRGDFGVPFNDADIAAIKKGETTQSDIVRMFGAPDTIIEVNNREVFHYYRYALKHGTFLIFSRINIAGDELYVFFDQNGRVDQVLFSKKTDKLKFQFWPFGT
ncbi:MAG: outer membrane protein assembly factor BamE [Acidobacteriia bacterium]|nr:outer membrane protein assembly factor BamE [Methyloceanibacter sp.]MCL6491804.1 outer membrane protein assembly factor BamE [Terriglobia bacterium]